MVDTKKSEFRKRDIFYLAPLWLLSLIAPDPYLYHKKEFKKKDLFYLGAICLAPSAASRAFSAQRRAGSIPILLNGLPNLSGHARR